MSAILDEECLIRLRIDWIAIVCLDMRVSDHHYMSIVCFKLLVHLEDLLERESVSVKHEVLLILGVANVHPEDIHRVFILDEVKISLDDVLSACVVPLTEMETKRVEGWHLCKACDLSIFLNDSFTAFYSISCSGGEHKHIDDASFGDEVSICDFLTVWIWLLISHTLFLLLLCGG